MLGASSFRGGASAASGRAPALARGRTRLPGAPSGSRAPGAARCRRGAARSPRSRNPAAGRRTGAARPRSRSRAGRQRGGARSLLSGPRSCRGTRGPGRRGTRRPAARDSCCVPRAGRARAVGERQLATRHLLARVDGIRASGGYRDKRVEAERSARAGERSARAEVERAQLRRLRQLGPALHGGALEAEELEHRVAHAGHRGKDAACQEQQGGDCNREGAAQQHRPPSAAWQGPRDAA